MPDRPVAHLTRRDFLALAARLFLALSGSLGLGMLLRFLGFQDGSAPSTRFDLGAAENYPLGSRTILSQTPAVLLHTASGFVAFSLVCPHLGCTVQLAGDGFACPCHGSRFAADGALRSGPAARPLRRLRIDQTASGHLILSTD